MRRMPQHVSKPPELGVRISRFLRRVAGSRLLSAALLLLLSLVACVRQLPPATLESAAALTFTVYRDGTSSTYHADSVPPGLAYTGSLKFVVQSAITVIKTSNAVGSTISFQAGDFDLGAEWFAIVESNDITFSGQGIDVTVLRNNTGDLAKDTEPFSFTRSNRLVIRDLTVSAGGTARNSSDALDFDDGSDIVVERVKVTSSRGRGIVFDGKDAGANAERNIIRNCIIMNTPLSGIELLAASNNRIENCQISDGSNHGILLQQASSVASQPNKPSNNNVITGNLVVNSGRDGIRISAGNGNIITGNTIFNSSDDYPGHDGIRILSSNLLSCNDNIVELNTSTDNQLAKTQFYGLRIFSPQCQRTVVRGNNFVGNRTAEVLDNGTYTRFIFAPVADSYVQSDRTTSNFGAATTLQVDGSPNKHSLLTFNVTGISRPVATAKLRLYNVDSSSVGGEFYRISNPTWTESSVTWNTAPTADPTPFASLASVRAGNWYEVNLGSIVTGNGLVGLKITSTSSNGADYTSKEGSASFQPQLVVETAGP